MTNQKQQLIEQRYSDTYHDLVRYVQWQARRYAVRTHWALDVDDLVAEGFLVLTKLVPKYIDKPYNEFLVIAKSSIVNWYRTLFSQLNAQKRSGDWNILSVEWTFEAEADGKEFQEVYPETVALSQDANYINADPAMIAEHSTEFADRVASMSKFDQQVLGCLNGDNPRVDMYLDLARSRRTANYTNPTITVTPLIISRALCVEVTEVTESLSRIKSAFTN